MTWYEGGTRRVEAAVAFRPLCLVGHFLWLSASTASQGSSRARTSGAAPYMRFILRIALAFCCKKLLLGAAWAEPGAALRCAGAQIRASLSSPKSGWGPLLPAWPSCSSSALLACTDILEQNLYGIERRLNRSSCLFVLNRRTVPRRFLLTRSMLS